MMDENKNLTRDASAAGATTAASALVFTTDFLNVVSAGTLVLHVSVAAL